MRIPRFPVPAPWRVPLLLAVVAGVAVTSDAWRPTLLSLKKTGHLRVTSSADEGPGSLREAIFESAGADVRVQIRIETGLVRIASPLPPLRNPRGVAILAAADSCVLDAALVEGPALDLGKGVELVRGVTVRGAEDIGILIRADGVRLESVTVTDCGEGVHLVDGVGGLHVQESVFERNGRGIRISADGGNAGVHDCSFRDHTEAAVWSVSPTEAPPRAAERVRILGNRFHGDHISVVLLDVPCRVERNEFRNAEHAALYVKGPAVVEHNRFHGSRGVGAFADGTVGAQFRHNELDHNQAVGLLLRDGQETVVESNRLYRNGYGVAVVFGDIKRPNRVTDNLVLEQTQDGLFIVGASPVVRQNRAVGNRGAALRILDFISEHGERVESSPLLGANSILDNEIDEIVRGEYRLPDRRGR